MPAAISAQASPCAVRCGYARPRCRPSRRRTLFHGVFDRDRDAVQRSDSVAGADRLVRCFGGEPSIGGVDRDIGVQPRFQALDARKRSTGDRRRAAISAASAWAGRKVAEVMGRSRADDSGNHAARRRAMTGNLARQLVRALCHAAAIWSVSVIQTAAPCACMCCSACRSGRSRNGCPLTWVCSATPITSG